MSTEYTIVIEKDEDGYCVGSVPAIPGCHTQGKSIDQLLDRMEEASAPGSVWGAGGFKTNFESGTSGPSNFLQRFGGWVDAPTLKPRND